MATQERRLCGPDEPADRGRGRGTVKKADAIFLAAANTRNPPIWADGASSTRIETDARPARSCRRSGLSAASAHERVRKLRTRGVIQRTTVTVDPAAAGLGVLAFILVDAEGWMGDAETRDAFAAIPEIEGVHIIAGPASFVLKVRTDDTEDISNP